MPEPLVVYERKLSGKRLAMITIADHGVDGFRGHLRVDRRGDADRRGEGTAPLLAEVRGADRNEVLTILQRIADDDREILARLAQWRRDGDPLPPDVRVADPED